MIAKTRVEVISGDVYCAYCGKLLVRHDYPPTIPEQIILCNCDKANEELELYDKIKELYNAPLASNVVDLKVEEYREKLLGIGPTHFNHIIACEFRDPKNPFIGTIPEGGVLPSCWQK